MDRNNNDNTHTHKIKILHKCIVANTRAIWQHAAHTTDQLIISYLLNKSHTRKRKEERERKKKKKRDKRA